MTAIIHTRSFNRCQLSREDALWNKVYRTEARAKQKGKCAYCLEPITVKRTTADHVNPRSKGGTTKQENIKAACAPCNKAKGSKSETAFKRMLRDPPPSAGINVHLASMRFRLWTRTHLACKRILLSVGIRD